MTPDKRFGWSRKLRLSYAFLFHLSTGSHKGEIPAQKAGKDWRFHRQAIIGWISRGQATFEERQTNPPLDFS